MRLRGQRPFLTGVSRSAGQAVALGIAREGDGGQTIWRA
jgi:hypothetical protein